MDKLIMYFLLFIIYAFLGYICEVIYVFIITKKITNRGYLYGPLVPIYAFGALIFIIPFQELSLGNFVLDKWYLVLLLAFFVPTLLEYITSFIMEKIFHMRWWDYSDKILNINGRVCLRNSLMFGILVMVVMYLLHPYVTKSVVSLLNDGVKNVLSIILFAIIFADFILSTIKHISFAKLIKKANEAKEKLDLAILQKKEEFEIKKENAISFLSSRDFITKLNKFSLKYPTSIIKEFNKKIWIEWRN